MTTNKSGKPVYVIGLTGSIGSGKSAVGKMLEEMGVAVYDTDHMTHYLLNTPGPVYRQVLERFGSNLVSGPDQPIDRAKLGAIVFNDAKARADLEAIMHPAIWQLKARRVEEADGLVAFLVPLLFETNSQCQYDEVWTVVVSPEVQLERLRVRDKRSDAEILKRINAQMPQDKKAALSSVVIDNSGDLAATRALVIAAHAGALGRLRALQATDSATAPVIPAPAVDAPAPADSAKTAPVVDAPATADGAKPAPVVDAPAPAQTPDPDQLAAREQHYKGVLRDFGHLATDEALTRIGDVALTSGKQSRASMTMVVSAADSKDAAATPATPAAADAGTAAGAGKDAAGETAQAPKPAVSQERELHVEVLMSVRNRPGVDEPPPAPPSPPTPPAPPTPVPPPVPAPAPTPGPACRRHRFWRMHTPLVIGFMAFLAFLVTVLVLYAWHKPADVTPPAITVNTPAVTVNPPAVNVTVGGPTVTVTGAPDTTVKVVPGPVAVDPCPVSCSKPAPVVTTEVAPPAAKPTEFVPEYVPGASPCRLSGDQVSEPPAFAEHYLHHDIRWATARWTVTTTCRGTVVEGFDKEGYLLVHQEYGRYLAFVGQTTYKLLPDGRVQVDRFDGNNIFVGRTYRYR